MNRGPACALLTSIVMAHGSQSSASSSSSSSQPGFAPDRVSVRGGSSSRARGYCFTWNNPPGGADAAQALVDSAVSGTTCYCVAGREVAPTTGTFHLQGYIYCKNKISSSRVRAMFPGAHVELANGSPSQNLAYCMKDGDYVEANVSHRPVGQGARMDLRGLKDACHSGRYTVCSAIDAGIITSGSALRTWDRLERTRRAPERPDVRVGWFWGDTGAGKSRKAVEIAKEVAGDDWYLFSDEHGWWDGYDGQRFIIVDDCSPTSPGIGMLLRLCDRYPLNLGGKGTNRACRADRVIVTSHWDPNDIGGDRSAELVRRLSTPGTLDRAYIYHFTSERPGQLGSPDHPISTEHYAIRTLPSPIPSALPSSLGSVPSLGSILAQDPSV